MCKLLLYWFCIPTFNHHSDPSLQIISIGQGYMISYNGVKKILNIYTNVSIKYNERDSLTSMHKITLDLSLKSINQSLREIEPQN